MEEKNKLIAEFMGLKVSAITKIVNGTRQQGYYLLTEDLILLREHEEVIGGECVDILSEADYALPEEMRYNTSWDWLMPVVEKIESLRGFTKVNGYFILDSIGNYSRFILDDGTRIFESEIASTKLYSVFKAVIEFIEWYNENK